MNLSSAIRTARKQTGLSQRALARLAKTSHATLSTYENGKVDPGSRVVERVVRAAGFRLNVDLEPVVQTASGRHPGDELVEVLSLAEFLPRRTRARHLQAPIFPPL